MSKTRKPLVAVIIAVFIFLSFVGATRYYISQNVNLVRVVAAAEPIPPRTQVLPEKLKLIQVPAGHVPEEAASNKDTFAREAYFTGNIGLHPGEVLTRQKVFTEDSIEFPHTLTLGPGETILGVGTDLVRSAGASVRSGSRVRALAYIPPVDGGMGRVAVPSRVEVVFDNLRVIQTVNSDAADAGEQEQRGRIPVVVNIAVTPAQEKVLIKYQEEYRVWFTVLPENYKPDPNAAP